MSYPDPNFTYGSAAYRLVVPAANQRAPQPRARLRSVWVEIPYGGNVRVKDGGKGPTIWSPAGGIEIQDEGSYNAMSALFAGETAATLVTPWGTFQAFLTSFDQVVYFPGEGVYRGQVTFEWA